MTRPSVIAVIGKSNKDPMSPPSPEALRAAELVGANIAGAGAILITGGLSGVMEAASRGAKRANGLVIGMLPGFRKEDANPYVDVAITTVLLLLGALMLMLPVTWVYMAARPIPGHNQNVVQTLIILPLVVAGIVFVIQNSLALAFSLAGVVGAVRFRTTMRDSRDLVYIFLSIVVGFAAGDC